MASQRLSKLQREIIKVLYYYESYLGRQGDKLDGIFENGLITMPKQKLAEKVFETIGHKGQRRMSNGEYEISYEFCTPAQRVSFSRSLRNLAHKGYVNAWLNGYITIKPNYDEEANSERIKWTPECKNNRIASVSLTSKGHEVARKLFGDDLMFASFVFM